MFPLRSQYIKVVVRGMPLCLAASSYDNRFSLRSKSSHFAWPPLPNAVWDGRLGQLAFESLSHMSEFIYVLENASMPGLVKIGRTERNVSERVSELSSHTGVPTGFIVVNEYAVANSVEAERIIHDRLSDYRVADNREFFKMEAEDAKDIIESMLEAVKSERRYALSGTRLRKIDPSTKRGYLRPRNPKRRGLHRQTGQAELRGGNS
jgi:hypothetical protein